MSNLSTFFELIESANDVKELIVKILPHVKDVGVMVKPLLKDFAEVTAEITDATIKKYKDLGYTHAEAIQLTLWNKDNLYKRVNSKME